MTRQQILFFSCRILNMLQLMNELIDIIFKQSGQFEINCPLLLYDMLFGFKIIPLK